MTSFEGVPVSSRDLVLFPSVFCAKTSLSLAQLTTINNSNANSSALWSSNNNNYTSPRGGGGGSKTAAVIPLWQVNPLGSSIVLPFAPHQPASASASSPLALTTASSAAGSASSRNATTMTMTNSNSKSKGERGEEDINWKAESARSALQLSTRADVKKRLARKTYARFTIRDPDTRRHSPLHTVQEGVMQLPRSGGTARANQSPTKARAGTRTSSRQSNKKRGDGATSSTTTDEDDEENDDRVPIHPHAAEKEWARFVHDDGTFAPAMLSAVCRPLPCIVRYQTQLKQLEQQQQQLEQQHVQLFSSSPRNQQQQLQVKGRQRKSIPKNSLNRVVPVEQKQQKDKDETTATTTTTTQHAGGTDGATLVPRSPSSVVSASSSTTTGPVPPPPPTAALRSHCKVLHVGGKKGGDESSRTPVRWNADQLALPAEYAPPVPIKNKSFLVRGSSTKRREVDDEEQSVTGSKNFGIASTALKMRTVVGEERRGAAMLTVSPQTCGFQQAFLYRLGDM